MSADALAADLADLLNARAVLQGCRRAGESLAETACRLAEEARRPRVVESKPSRLGSFVSPRQLVERCPGITRDSLKWMLFRAESNGLEAHVVRVGRKVLIDEEGFVGWLRGLRRASVRRRERVKLETSSPAR